MRGETFQALADALGITSSGLRRWANRGRVPGAALIRGRWILRGPLTIRRIEKIRSYLNLKPLIAKGRRKENPLPVKRKQKRDKTARAKVKRCQIKETRTALRDNEKVFFPGILELRERDRLRKRLARLEGVKPTAKPLLAE